MAFSGNVLSVNMEAVETSVADWTTGGGSSAVAQSTTQSHSATHSCRATANGTVGTLCVANTQPSCQAGQNYTAYYWVFSPKAIQVYIQIDWRTSGGTFISSSGSGNTTLVANTWTQISLAVTAPATAAKFTFIAGETSSGTNLANTDLIYFDDFYLGDPTTVSYPGNILDYNTQSIETDITNWRTAQSGESAIAKSSLFSLPNYGANSLAVTSNGVNGNLTVYNPTITVKASTDYDMFVWVYTVSSGYTLVLQFDWSAGVTYLSTSTSAATAITANQWNLIKMSVTSPGTADNGTLYTTVSSGAVSTNVLYFDGYYIGPSIAGVTGGVAGCVA